MRKRGIFGLSKEARGGAEAREAAKKTMSDGNLRRLVGMKLLPV